nr:MAG: ORF1 [Giant panda anellovirus]
MVRWARRYRRRRWRPYTRRGYGRFRSGLRRNRWRRHRRVRRRRRTFYRKRPYVGPLVQWHPKHRALCTIHGWGIAFYGLSTNTTTNFQTWQIRTGNKPGYYKYYGGGVSIYSLTLDWLYEEHLKAHNTWSRSNEGFDLARYFGTKFILPPHPTIDYIFWWRTDYGTLKKQPFQELHPAVAITNPKHIIIKSIKNGGRRSKKVFISPPSVHNSQWYFMKQWCDASLLKFGFTMIELKNQFIHTGSTRPMVLLGSASGVKTPLQIPTTKTIPTTANQVYYKYDWDTGIGNKVGYGTLKTSTQVLQVSIAEFDMPYWLYFYGQGWQNFNNSNVYFWWWYEDYTSKDTWAPQDLPDQTKQWILIEKFTGNKDYAHNVIDLVQNGPMVKGSADIDGSNIFNLSFLYKSYWQWGGTNPVAPPNLNPCEQPPAGNFGYPVRIGNPATTGAYMLHPWDLDPTGIITTDKLRNILRFSDSDDPQKQKELPKTSNEIDSAPYNEEENENSSSEESSSSRSLLRCMARCRFRSMSSGVLFVFEDRLNQRIEGCF